MAEPILNKARAEQNIVEPSIESNVKYELGEELLKEPCSNTYSRRVEEDVVGHIAKILEILDLIKIASVDPFQLRMKTFPLSLSGDARKCNYDKMCDDDEEEVGNNEGIMDEVVSSDNDRDHTNSSMITKPEINIADEFLKILHDNSFNGVDGIIATTWKELGDKFFHKYYPLSHAYKSKIPYDLDHGTDYFEFIYWLASKFDNYWELDKNIKNGLWEFYVNGTTKGTIDDLVKYNKPYEENNKKTCLDLFFKPYLDEQDGKDIYEFIDRDYSLIPIPTHHDIGIPDELCQTEEFTVVRFIMDDPNITMEEYIRLKEEKARRHGQTFNWQTATYGKMKYCINEDDSFTNLETEYPAIVFDDTSDAALSCEPTVAFQNPQCGPFNTAYSLTNTPYIHKNLYMAPLPHRDLRHPWLRYQVEGYDEDRLSMIYTRDDGNALFTSHAWRRLFEIKEPLVREFMMSSLAPLGGARRRMTWRQFILALGLHTEEEMAEAGFGAYWQGSERVILDKGDLRDYWMEISFDRDFLGPAPSYVFIQDPVRRLCHKMIACNISEGGGQEPEEGIRRIVDLFYLRSMDRGTANVLYLLAQYLFRHAEGRKSGARLSEGYFIGCLTAHFGLVSDQGLRGLSLVASELSLIDLHEFGRLNIYLRVGNTWAWLALGLERQQAGAPGAPEDAPVVDEGAQAVRAPIQAPQPPPPAPQHGL
ncbi:hypothetical protein Tco_1410346 [Tanacetum coccineum]